MRSRLLTVLAGAALALGITAAPAAAHDTLVDSTPTDGAVLVEPPADVVLEFSADILELNPAIEITHEDGTPVEVHPAQIDGVFVRWELVDRYALAAGGYEVVWAVTSSDGHPIDGTLAFTVEEGATPEGSPSPEASASPEESETPESTTTAEPTDPAPSPTGPEPSTSEDELTATAEPEDPSEISSTAEAWFFAGLAVTVLVVVAIVLAVRRGRDPNGPPGQH